MGRLSVQLPVYSYLLVTVALLATLNPPAAENTME